MIIGFHLSWTTYGHWFPNDPRGSWSHEIWKPDLAKVRPLDNGHKIGQRRPVAKAELQEFLDSARAELRWKTVNLSTEERAVVADAFREAAHATGLIIRACAILYNHVHIIVDRPVGSYERVVNRLKGRSSQAIRAYRNISPSPNRRHRVPIWTRGYWCRYIDNPEYMEHAIRYVQEHNMEQKPFHRQLRPVGRASPADQNREYERAARRQVK
ncbi:MAG: transposase [Phycisphaerae bacterium]